jgi:hypothetical protein
LNPREREIKERERELKEREGDLICPILFESSYHPPKPRDAAGIVREKRLSQSPSTSWPPWSNEKDLASNIEATEVKQKRSHL